ncbi:MAG: YceK/YidQ family lipoprotein [Enterobacteriaceae bacterium]|jgi:uncharacterized protein YceK|nr:YceK/YidQ family lipoprotein [Enterobacteriaceae bacterium]
MITCAKRSLLPVCTSSSLFLLAGCSSLMAHVAPYEGYYSGTTNDAKMISDDSNGWVMRSLLVIDLPFSAALDTVLLPYDYYRSDDSESRESPRKKISESDEEKQASGQLQGSGYVEPDNEHTDSSTDISPK